MEEDLDMMEDDQDMKEDDLNMSQIGHILLRNFEHLNQYECSKMIVNHKGRILGDFGRLGDDL